MTEKNFLAQILNFRPTSENAQPQAEQFFDAGERIKLVRDELELKSSQLVELTGMSSQREYERMENREIKSPLSLLRKMSELSGVNLEWLMHGKEDRYEISEVNLRNIQEDLEYCASLQPQEYFLILDKKSLHVGLIAQTGKYRYQVIETGVTLDFWTWVDTHWAISAFYHFLKALSDPWHDIDGIILPSQYDKKLFQGEIHYLAALRNADRFGGDLLYDLLDLDETRLSRQEFYARKYGGDWMHKVHQYFKEYLQLEKERKENRNLGKRIEKEKVSQTIIFQEPTQLPSYERIFVWMYPFTVVETSLIGQPQEINRTALQDITVTMSFELASMWDLFHPISSTNNQAEIDRVERDKQNIRKILFWYGKRAIENKLKAGTLQLKERLDLLITSPEIVDRLDVSRVPEPNGFKFEI